MNACGYVMINDHAISPINNDNAMIMTSVNDSSTQGGCKLAAEPTTDVRNY